MEFAIAISIIYAYPIGLSLCKIVMDFSELRAFEVLQHSSPARDRVALTRLVFLSNQSKTNHTAKLQLKLKTPEGTVTLLLQILFHLIFHLLSREFSEHVFKFINRCSEEAHKRLERGLVWSRGVGPEFQYENSVFC